MASSPYKLVREQVVSRPPNEVFAFFSCAENLQEITPPWLSFNVVRVQPQPLSPIAPKPGAPGTPLMQKGTRIDYRLKVRGLPLRWTSEIVLWEPPHQFVDVQVRGPYQLWHHTHRFVEEGSATRITDEVLYRLPFGLLGELAHWAMVRRDVEKIFDYREAKVRSLFA